MARQARTLNALCNYWRKESIIILIILELRIPPPPSPGGGGAAGRQGRERACDVAHGAAVEVHVGSEVMGREVAEGHTRGAAREERRVAQQAGD